MGPVTTPRVFYGWVVVGAAFAVTFVGFGSAYTFSAFVQPLQSEFGASRGSVSLVFSLAGFLYFGLGVVSGPLADRWGPRRLAILGMSLVGLGLMLAAGARSLVEVYAAYGLGVGLGVGFAYVPVVGTVQRWFVKRRGLASGLAVSGIGLGTLVMPPLTALLIEIIGWRETYLVLGASAAALGIGASLLIESEPSVRGLAPDGAFASIASTAERRAAASIRAAISSKAFRTLYAACLICSFGVFVPFVHLVPYAADHGIGQTAAAMLLGLIGAGSTTGRFVLGGIADRMGRPWFLVTAYAGMALAMAIWALGPTFASLAIFALVFGLFYGGWVAILPSVVMDRFGGANVSGLIGVLYTSVAFGTLIGPTVAGHLFDSTHSYLLPIICSLAANIAAAAITARALCHARRPELASS
jgi:OFA family oxalate/formate antiporter-like MFS transporter